LLVKLGAHSEVQTDDGVALDRGPQHLPDPVNVSHHQTMNR
jgi:hypothetical protein